MHTITIDILNDKALSLLRNLEQLKLIHLRKDVKEQKAKVKWLNYKGAMEQKQVEDVDQQLDELRNEWE